MIPVDQGLREEDCPGSQGQPGLQCEMLFQERKVRAQQLTVVAVLAGDMSLHFITDIKHLKFQLQGIWHPRGLMASTLVASWALHTWHILPHINTHTHK